MPKTLRNSQPLVFAVLVLAAVGLRLLLLPFTNHDLTDAVIPWYEYMIRNGGLQAINGLLDSANGFPAYIYSPPYLYLLAAAIPLTKWFSTVEVIKLVSIVFDFVSAIAVFYLVKLKFPTGWKKWAGFFAVCFAPTVFINSAYWGQFDGIYTAFLVVCLYFVCTGRISLSLVFFATALAFKLQAVLFVPLYVVLFFQKKINWWKFFHRADRLFPLDGSGVPEWVSTIGAFHHISGRSDAVPVHHHEHAQSVHLPSQYVLPADRSIGYLCRSSNLPDAYLDDHPPGK